MPGSLGGGSLRGPPRGFLTHLRLQRVGLRAQLLQLQAARRGSLPTTSPERHLDADDHARVHELLGGVHLPLTLELHIGERGLGARQGAIARPEPSRRQRWICRHHPVLGRSHPGGRAAAASTEIVARQLERRVTGQAQHAPQRAHHPCVSKLGLAMSLPGFLSIFGGFQPVQPVGAACLQPRVDDTHGGLGGLRLAGPVFHELLEEPGLVVEMADGAGDRPCIRGTFLLQGLLLQTCSGALGSDLSGTPHGQPHARVPGGGVVEDARDTQP